MVIGTCQQMAAWEQVDFHHHLSRQSERESGERERERERERDKQILKLLLEGPCN